MASSASTIARGIINNLSAASVLGACTIDTNYSVLETTSGCCAVIHWTDLVSAPIDFGGGTGEDYAHYIEFFIRDTGDFVSLMDNVFKLIDKAIDSVASDQTLQGTVSMVTRLEASNRPQEMVDVSGQMWKPFYLSIESSII